MQNVSSRVYRALGLLTPYDIDVGKRLVGGDRDGAYVLADNFAQRDVISIGIDNNDDFDHEMAEAGHRIFMFDHTVAGPPRAHDNYSFYKVGICGARGGAPDCKSLDEILSLVDSRARLILKMDVEGEEWEVFSSASVDSLAHFDQILVEVHWLENLEEEAFRSKFCKSLKNINKLFTLFHVHGNNNCNVNIVEGFPVASVLELSFVKTDMVARRRSSTVYPSLPNCANNSAYHDLPLLFYPFLPLGASDEALDEVIMRIEQQHDAAEQ